MDKSNRLIGGKYQIVRKLAEGGMGEVFVAEHNLTRKKVALKLLFPHVAKDEAARQRFLREVRAPAQIGHDGIVEVHDAGFDIEDGSLFVVMEFLEGEPLRDRMSRGGVSLDLMLDWFERILDPLAMAHEKGIVHRDLKPENVFLSKRRDGSEIIKILDFGIARDLDASQNNVTHTGIAMGTPHYMAPEQAMSAKGVYAQADVWALGVMLYEALTGRPPFDGETPSAIVVLACTQAHTPVAQVAPQVPRPLSDFVDRLLQKDPAHRPANAGQMLAELRAVRQQIGSVSGVAAAAAGLGGLTNVPQTGSLAGQSAFTPSGTAMLPQASSPGYAPTGAAFGTPNPGYSSPGYGTSPAGAFGPNPSAPGFGAPNSYASGAYGSPPSGGGFGPPTGYAEPKRGGGMAVGVIAGVLIVGLVLVGGGIAAALWLMNDGGDDSGPTVNTVTTANLRIDTNVQTGELVVDGISRGPVVPNQQVSLEAGAHRLELRESGITVATADVTVTAGQDQTVSLNRSGTTVATNDPGSAMVPGRLQTITGSLQRGDQMLQSGEYMDAHNFDWTAGTTVQIEMDSNDFDSYLILKAPSGAQRDNDDRAPGQGLGAGITMTLQETGRWQVICTSYAPNSTGDYTLRVRAP